MPDPTTSRLSLPYPVGGDLVSQAPQEFDSLATTIDTLYGLEYEDFLNPGVVGNAAVLNATGPFVNSSTGVITTNLSADVAWVDNGSSVLTRTLLPTGTQNLTPGSLPTSGGFMNIGVYVQSGVWSATGTLVTSSGSQQSSQANALASPPFQPSDSVLLMYCIVQNSAGAYLLAQAVDERKFLSVRTSLAGSSGQDYGGAAQVPSNTHTAITGLSVTTASMQVSQILVVWFSASISASGASNVVSASLTLNGVETGTPVSTSDNSGFPSLTTVQRFAGLVGTQTLAGNVWASSSGGATQAGGSSIFYEIRNS